MSQGYHYTPAAYDADDDDSDIVLASYRTLIDELALSIIYSAASPNDARNVVRSFFDSRQGVLDHTFNDLVRIFRTAIHAVDNADTASNQAVTAPPQPQDNRTSRPLQNLETSNGLRGHLSGGMTAQNGFAGIDSQTTTPTAPIQQMGAQNAVHANGLYAPNGGNLERPEQTDGFLLPRTTYNPLAVSQLHNTHSAIHANGFHAPDGGGPTSANGPLLPQTTYTSRAGTQPHNTQNLANVNGTGALRATDQPSDSDSSNVVTNAPTQVQQTFSLPPERRDGPPWRLRTADGRRLPQFGAFRH